jgi:hypothetical protein
LRRLSIPNETSLRTPFAVRGTATTLEDVDAMEAVDPIREFLGIFLARVAAPDEKVARAAPPSTKKQGPL